MKSSNTTYIFTDETFQKAMDKWKKEQIVAYPHQQERIEITALAMKDFMKSQQIIDYKMTLNGVIDISEEE